MRRQSAEPGIGKPFAENDIAGPRKGGEERGHRRLCARAHEDAIERDLAETRPQPLGSGSPILLAARALPVTQQAQQVRPPLHGSKPRRDPLPELGRRRLRREVHCHIHQRLALALVAQDAR